MFKNYFKVTILLFLTNSALHAQAYSTQQELFKQIYSTSENEYGIDQELINGLLFENKNQDAGGHPYFLDYYTNQGKVIYRGKQYSNLFLRYDIYHQQVLLIYYFDNAEYKLYLQNEFINEFNIGNKKFIQETFDANEDPRFYQVIGENSSLKILYYWEKFLSDLRSNDSDKRMFSSEQKKTFLLLNTNLISYKGNNSFTRQFSSRRKTAIKKYFRVNKMNVKKAKDSEMELLIEFINTLEI